ncbi:MAG: hypothetical protein ACYC2G_15940 [Gemmatimonadaceae bacterium]
MKAVHLSCELDDDRTRLTLGERDHLPEPGHRSRVEPGIGQAHRVEPRCLLWDGWEGATGECPG